MSQVKLNIKLLEMTQNAISIIYAACRQCYSTKFAGEIFEEKKDDMKKQEEFIKKVVKSGHESPLEHVKFTFAIEGVSRALTHQLVRHRIASYSQQSQRYVKETNFDYIIPPSIEEDETLRDEFVKVMGKIQTSYNKILKKFKEKGIVGEKANQDVRFILPQAAETKIVVTMNCRELLHFFEQRCCARAQWEIRNLANKMLEICKEHLPAVFSNAGAKCERLGYCPEGRKFTCGKYPLKEDVIKKR
ncbi:FAD-dependent thymidylate synthase [Candidatus Aerophobetes bacterium]|nr:FAD-dependent thymidylate synthase [Candidatus Aerophobetes bacterium]